jgi:Ankyrin repeats (3 copies)/Ankyrin repeats (many copies)
MFGKTYTANLVSTLIKPLALSNSEQLLLKFSRQGDVQGVQKALANGANINVTEIQAEYYGYTPLIYACRFGRKEVVDALIHHARLNKIELKLRHTTGAKKGWQAIHWAAHEGHVACIQALLGEMPLLIYEQETFEARTPLHLAIINHQVAVEEVLLAKGADSTIKDDYGKTPEEYRTLKLNTFTQPIQHIGVPQLTSSQKLKESLQHRVNMLSSETQENRYRKIKELKSNEKLFQQQFEIIQRKESQLKDREAIQILYQQYPAIYAPFFNEQADFNKIANYPPEIPSETIERDAKEALHQIQNIRRQLERGELKEEETELLRAKGAFYEEIVKRTTDISNWEKLVSRLWSTIYSKRENDLPLNPDVKSSLRSLEEDLRHVYPAEKFHELPLEEQEKAALIRGWITYEQEAFEKTPENQPHWKKLNQFAQALRIHEVALDEKCEEKDVSSQLRHFSM